MPFLGQSGRKFAVLVARSGFVQIELTLMGDKDSHSIDCTNHIPEGNQLGFWGVSRMGRICPNHVLLLNAVALVEAALNIGSSGKDVLVDATVFGSGRLGFALGIKN